MNDDKHIWERLYVYVRDTYKADNGSFSIPDINRIMPPTVWWVGLKGELRKFEIASASLSHYEGLIQWKLFKSDDMGHDWSIWPENAYDFVISLIESDEAKRLPEVISAIERHRGLSAMSLRYALMRRFENLNRGYSKASYEDIPNLTNHLLTYL